VINNRICVYLLIDSSFRGGAYNLHTNVYTIFIFVRNIKDIR